MGSNPVVALNFFQARKAIVQIACTLRRSCHSFHVCTAALVYFFHIQ